MGDYVIRARGASIGVRLKSPLPLPLLRERLLFTQSRRNGPTQPPQRANPCEAWFLQLRAPCGL
jgi:hypothetical protein